MDYSQAFDIVKMEKLKAITRYNLLRRFSVARHILELAALLAFISWSPAAARTAVRISAHLLNHRLVFLVGNAIIALLFVLFRSAGGGGSVMNEDYVKHSEAAAHQAPPPREVEGGCEERRTVAARPEAEPGKPPGDDLAAAIERAAKQIRRFERTQSEKLRREIGARPRAALRRSESENRRAAAAGEGGAVEMERLSSEEFRRTVDEFINRHWCKKKTKA
ncbi:N-(5'-phosphoribosyl)anthranilate isomerase [Striga asiatica]|uniref:N-(5'-phosphoribosyl)anthranilate isomerase n=1 Tax=Striga asiatica TaxID=4170 RepID=A0A5A7P258_STRAF|nr:N-(5'-phosphoribosyl)anthranilate isomerase [Striga asiatica]